LKGQINKKVNAEMVQDTGSFQFVSPHEWHDFCRYLQTQNRYVLNEKWAKFVQTVLFTAKKREHILKQGKILYRARIGIEEYEYEMKDKEGKSCPNIGIAPISSQEINAPPGEKAREGRINPRGISYLYLSNNAETALSEVRPWLDKLITVGQFHLCKDVTVVDASQDKHGRYFISERKIEEPSDKWESYVWRDINKSFSTPVSNGEEHRHYVQTQYLSECFKNAGYDGIMYRSSLTMDGYNIALFDPQNARLKAAGLYDIKSVKYEFGGPSNVYVCKNESDQS
jgi:RES domain-containing protein